MNAPRPCARRGAFTLLELLAVMTIIALMVALIAPNIASVTAAQKLRGAVSALADAMGNARKIAIATNREVEFRICTDANSLNYAGYQVMTFDQFGVTSTQAQRPQRLPNGFTFADDNRSNFLSDNPNTTAQPAQPISTTGPTGGNISYYAFHFLPDGSTDLPNAPSPAVNWYLTITYQTAAKVTSQSPTLASVAIDPITGVVTTYQP